MKVLLTIGFDTDSAAFARDLVTEAERFVDIGGAERAAVDARVGGEEHDLLQEIDTEHDASAVVSLWGVDSTEAALKFPLPAGGRLVGAYHVDEVVQRDYDRTWPAGSVSPGVKLVCLVRRKRDITHDAYSEHWRTRHGPLALAHQPGFWHYVQNHVVEWLTDTTPDVDGVGELHFKSAPEVETGMFDSDEGQRLIFEDTERFLDHTRSTVLATNETLVGGSNVPSTER